MTLTFNLEQYALLLTKYHPKVIETEHEYRQALTVVEYFVFTKERTPEELALYDLAIMLNKMTSLLHQDVLIRQCPLYISSYFMVRSLVIVILLTLSALPFIICLLLMAVVFFASRGAEKANKKTIVTLSALACPACRQIYGVEAAELAQHEYIDACQAAINAKPSVRINFVRFWLVRCPNCQTTTRYYYQIESLEAESGQSPIDTKQSQF